MSTLKKLTTFTQIHFDDPPKVPDKHVRQICTRHVYDLVGRAVAELHSQQENAICSFTLPAFIKLTDPTFIRTTISSAITIGFAPLRDKDGQKDLNFIHDVRRMMDEFYYKHDQNPNTLFITPHHKEIYEIFMNFSFADTEKEFSLFGLRVHVSNWFGCALI